MSLLLIISCILSNSISADAVTYVRVYFDNYYTQFDKVFVEAGDSQGFGEVEMKELEGQEGILYVEFPKGYGLRHIRGVGGYVTGTYGDFGAREGVTFDSVWCHQLKDDTEPMIFVYTSDGEKYVPYSTYVRENISSTSNIGEYSPNLRFSEQASDLSSLFIGGEEIDLTKNLAKGDGWEYKSGYLYLGEKSDFNDIDISAKGNLTIISVGNNKLGNVSVDGNLVVTAQIGKLDIDGSKYDERYGFRIGEGEIVAKKIVFNVSAFASINFVTENNVKCDCVEFNGEKKGCINFLCDMSEKFVQCEDCVINNENSIIYVYGYRVTITANNSFIINGGNIYCSRYASDAFYCLDEVIYNDVTLENRYQMHNIHFATDFVQLQAKTETPPGIFVKTCMLCGKVLKVKYDWPTRSVVFKDSDGTQLDKKDVIYGNDVIAPDVGKEGYTLSWDKPLTDIKEDTTINAVWTLKKYNVVFKDEDGSIISEQTIGHGNDATAPNVKKEGYTLSWDKPLTTIKEDTIINAVWTLKKYKVVFKDEDGSVISEQTIGHGDDATAPFVRKEGYTLSWDKPLTDIKEDTTINAVWTLKKYNVVFKDEDGSIISEQTIGHGNDATAPNVKKEGYTLSWNKGYKNIKEDTTINAIWTLITYDLEKADVRIYDDAYVYDGQAHTPKVVITYSGKKLEEGKDYKLTVGSEVNAGSYSVVIVGSGIYVGRRVVNYRIDPVSIDDANIDMSNNIFTYDGSLKMPQIEVSLYGKTLTINQDYVVSYRDNIEVGTAYAVINGVNNYSGHIEVSFKILPYQSGMDAVYKEDDTLMDGDYVYHIIDVDSKEVELVASANNKITEVVVPATITTVNGDVFTVTSIGEKAFYRNTKIKKLTVSNTVKSIENYAFYGCKNLTTIKIGNGIDIVGNSAFRKCTKLISITLPKSIDKLGKNTFYGCTKLRTITIKANQVIDIQTYAIKGVSKKCVIKVPRKLVKKYIKKFNSKTGFSKGMRIKKIS